MDYHRYSGYGLLGLLLFRLYWGFVGSDTAPYSLSGIYAYIPTGATLSVGYEPFN